jgi:hypothetical protein
MKLNSKLLAARSLLVLFCVSLFSFSSKPGADSFEVWLNGKRMFQQYVHVAKTVQTLQLAQASENDKLDVYYNHCGRTGTNRYITIKDENDRPLKVWKFAEATGSNTAMSFKLKDILGLKKNKNDKLNLFYSSTQLPNGRLLAVIVAENERGIARK